MRIIGLPSNAKELLIDLMENFDDFGAEVFLEDQAYICRNHEVCDMHFKIIKVPVTKCTMEQLPPVDTWCKLNLTGDPDYLKKVYAYAEQNYSGQFTFMFSAPYFFEITNPTANKGTSVNYIGQYLGIDKDKIFAIGDNHNDKHMIEAAHIGFAPSNADNVILNIADVVLCDNNTGAVADAIYYIENLIDKQN